MRNSSYNNENTELDARKGVEYIQRASELGNADAQMELGSFYGIQNAKGGVKKNFVMNYYWATLASINGASDAIKYNYVQQHFSAFKKQGAYCISLGQTLVSNAYKNGIGGLEKSYDESMSWLNKAYEIDAKIPMVTFNLAQNYYTYEANENKAFSYAKESAQAPYAPSLELLGQYYLKGIGTNKNDVNAYVYLTLASYYYQNPAKSYWEKYVEPCRPDYTKNPQGFNLASTNKSLEKIKLSNSEKQQAEIMIEKLKGELVKAGV